MNCLTAASAAASNAGLAGTVTSASVTAPVSEMAISSVTEAARPAAFSSSG